MPLWMWWQICLPNAWDCACVWFWDNLATFRENLSV